MKKPEPPKWKIPAPESPPLRPPTVEEMNAARVLTTNRERALLGLRPLSAEEVLVPGLYDYRTDKNLRAKA